jgi:transposase InsO family protein
VVTATVEYIATDEGWLYLTGVIDLFIRQVVGWSMSCANTSLPWCMTVLGGNPKTNRQSAFRRSNRDQTETLNLAKIHYLTTS